MLERDVRIKDNEKSEYTVSYHDKPEERGVPNKMARALPLEKLYYIRTVQEKVFLKFCINLEMLIIFSM